MLLKPQPRNLIAPVVGVEPNLIAPVVGVEPAADEALFKNNGGDWIRTSDIVLMKHSL